MGNGFKVTMREQGTRGLVLGWAPTAIGYSMQGLCKFGFYEVFKNLYGDMIGEENAYLYRTSLYLAASASAEFFADIALSPMESVKVRFVTKFHAKLSQIKTFDILECRLARLEPSPRLCEEPSPRSWRPRA